MDAVLNILNQFLHMTQTFGPNEWAIVSLATVVIGYMCLKGMNIR